MIGGANDNGLCFLEWTDRGSVSKILRRVEKRYKQPAVEVKQNKFLDKLQTELDEYFSGNRQKFAIPISVTGTPFEQNVWNELLTIPYGKTRSYGEMAKRLDKPGGSRAVGRANGANYLAIVIPCHRVITADGGIGGYGGKVWRKKKLLELEQRPALGL